MPFGSERKEMERNKESAIYDQLLENKEFLEVTAMMRTNGNIIPISFQWEDREIKIDKVLNCQLGSSLKEGIAGRRYLCQVRNKRFYLYFTGRQWYMD
jgi:hypothetical protein